MDNVTHGLAGLLVADAASQWLARRGVSLDRRRRRAMSVLGVVAAEFPDSDLVYSGPVLDMGPLGYLLHHRGHTHTLVWATVSALLLWLLARWYVARGDGAGGGTLTSGSLNGGSATNGMVRATLAVVALVGTWSHLLLDFTNSYGVHPFWPFDGRWFYGDAVFIVEPWLWLVSIPPLFWNRPSRVGQVVLVLLQCLIVAATLLLGQVARDVALLLVGFAVLWPVLHWRLRDHVRTTTGLTAWAMVTVGFFAASSRAAAAVRTAVEAVSATERVLDVSLNPGPGDWGCWSALVMSTDGVQYRVSSAFVAPFTGARALATCETRYRAGRIGSDVLDGLSAVVPAPFAGTAEVRWRSSWSAPVAELSALARTRCEAHAALYFMRAPVWQPAGSGTLLMSDARFGVGGGGFSELPVPTTGACTLTRRWIPGWVPPRAELLHGSTAGAGP